MGQPEELGEHSSRMRAGTRGPWVGMNLVCMPLREGQ